jgi:dihydrofolate reductase
MLKAHKGSCKIVVDCIVIGTHILARKLIYYVATTADGFIAHRDETVDGFLADGPHIGDYLTSLRDYDTVLMGRNTYEWGYQFGIKPGEPSPTYGHMMQYVFSQTMELYDHPQLQVIRENPAAFVSRLKEQDGGAIYLCGGGKLAGTLFEHRLVDGLILKVNPVVFGQGIPAFGALDRTIPLLLRDVRVYANGVQFVSYDVGANI